MVLYNEDGNKLACGTCIRGHRVNGCDHRGRELVVINQVGRPRKSPAAAGAPAPAQPAAAPPAPAQPAAPPPAPAPVNLPAWAPAQPAAPPLAPAQPFAPALAQPFVPAPASFPTRAMYLDRPKLFQVTAFLTAESFRKVTAALDPASHEAPVLCMEPARMFELAASLDPASFVLVASCLDQVSFDALRATVDSVSPPLPAAAAAVNPGPFLGPSLPAAAANPGPFQQGLDGSGNSWSLAPSAHSGGVVAGGEPMEEVFGGLDSQGQQPPGQDGESWGEALIWPPSSPGPG